MSNIPDDFVDKLKQPAENFSLKPSDQVWEKVESDIQQRERNKKFIIFFFIGMLIITGGILFIYNQNSNTNKETAIQQSKQTTEKSKISENKISVIKDRTIIDNASDQFIDKEHHSKSNNKSNLQNNKSSKPLVSASKKTDLNSLTQKTSIQNNNLYNKTSKTDEVLPIQQTASVQSRDSMAEEFAFENNKISVPVSVSIDSLIETKSDTTKKDSLSVLSDSLKILDNKSKWGFSLGIAPTLSFTQRQEQGDMQIISNYRDSTDELRVTWHYHFEINYKIIPQLQIFSGAGVRNFEQSILSKQAVQKYDTNHSTTLPFPPVSIVRGSFNINGDSTGTLKNKMSYLDIPIGVYYSFLPNHRFNILLRAAVSYHKLISSDLYDYNYQTFTYEKTGNSDLTSTMFSYSLGLSFQYAVRKNWGIGLTPNYSSFQNSIYRDSYPIKQHLQQTEFRISIHYMLK